MQSPGPKLTLTPEEASVGVASATTPSPMATGGMVRKDALAPVQVRTPYTVHPSVVTSCWKQLELERYVSISCGRLSSYLKWPHWFMNTYTSSTLPAGQPQTI